MNSIPWAGTSMIEPPPPPQMCFMVKMRRQIMETLAFLGKDSHCYHLSYPLPVVRYHS